MSHEVHAILKNIDICIKVAAAVVVLHGWPDDDSQREKEAGSTSVKKSTKVSFFLEVRDI